MWRGQQWQLLHDASFAHHVFPGMRLKDSSIRLDVRRVTIGSNVDFIGMSWISYNDGTDQMLSLIRAAPYLVLSTPKGAARLHALFRV